MAVIISHTAIIDKRGRILVLRRSAGEKVLPGFWDFPGGTVKIKENPTVGAIREVKEECGLRVSGLRLLTCASNWDRKKQENFVTLIFTTKKYSGRIKLNHRDHEEYAWLTKKELETIKAVEYFQEVLKLL